MAHPVSQQAYKSKFEGSNKGQRKQTSIEKIDRTPTEGARRDLTRVDEGLEGETEQAY